LTRRRNEMSADETNFEVLLCSEQTADGLAQVRVTAGPIPETLVVGPQIGARS
jgi:hypothetical protein